MNPSTLIFLGLAVVWVVVLLPEAVRKLSSTRGRDSIRSFNQQLSVLHRSGERSAAYAADPRTARDSNVIDLRSRPTAQTSRSASMSVQQPRRVPPSVRRRRQEVLTALGAAAVLTLLCTIAFGTAFLVIHLVADALLITYVALLAQVTKAEASGVRPSRDVVGGHRAVTHGAQSYGLRTATVGRVSPASRVSAASRSVAN